MKFNTILNECGLHDIWRLFNPDHREYTWSKRTPFVARWLDYTLTNSGVFDEATDCATVNAPMPDHRGVVKGNGYWKLNNSLLCEIEFVTQINTVIYYFLRENDWIIKRIGN